MAKRSRMKVDKRIRPRRTCSKRCCKSAERGYFLLSADFSEQVDQAIKTIYASSRRHEESMTALLQSLHSHQQ
nr:MAG TPA: hypothetical protein [Caudoviricetes sp.]